MPRCLEPKSLMDPGFDVQSESGAEMGCRNSGMRWMKMCRQGCYGLRRGMLMKGLVLMEK